MGDRFDALVIGGGPAGSTAALLLARAGWSVVLLERARFPRRKVCGEYLSATSLPLLEHLGVAEAFRERAGPEVRSVGLFAGKTATAADLPRSQGRGGGWGRALAREELDTLLLAQAARAGVDVRQPAAAVALRKAEASYDCLVKSPPACTQTVRAGLVIAAQGSWGPGPPARRPARPNDLLAFKAHFRASALPPSLMPLLAFPGGYGGMVHCSPDQVSLSCCIRRATLARLRRSAHETAGDVVLGHVLETCGGARRALAGARREGPWLAAGPIQPGIRLRAPHGIFPVGNVAGEAHPVIAEGISMALQAAGLLVGRLIAWRRSGAAGPGLRAVGRDYEAAWRRAFAPRLYAAAALATWAMQPAAVAGTLPLVRCFPWLLTWGARWSGKTTRVLL